MKLSFKQKIIGLTLLMGLVPMILLMALNMRNIYTMVDRQVQDGFETQSAAAIEATQDYFRIIHSQARVLANTGSTIDALKEFSAAFAAFDPALVTVDEAKYRGRYEYQQQNSPGSTLAEMAQWLKMTPKAKALQHLYISENSKDIGKKHEMDVATDGSAYSALHAKYHPQFRDFVQEFGYYDIFLIDVDGNVVYTDFKELDYATNLKTGPYASSGLGQAFARALENGDNGRTQMTDFEPYAPSYNGWASFIAVPVKDNGQVIGVVALQMPVDHINNLTSSVKFLGETADSYLVGMDSKLRSKPQRMEGVNIGGELDSELAAIIAKLGDKIDFTRWNDEKGDDVRVSIQPFEISRSSREGEESTSNLKWAVVVTQADKELMAPMYKSLIASFTVMAIMILAIIVVGLFVSNMLVRPIVQLGKSFGKSSEQVARATGQVSEAVSAMVAASEETSAQSTVIRKSSNEASGYVSSVSSAVEELNVSINDISQSIGETNVLIDDAVHKAQHTDDVVRHLGEAGKKISDVVQLINALAEQTNLLALNAAIEAARAGDAGRGFAVVADEVKKLANHTSQATVEIGQQVQNIQSVSEESAVALQAVVEAIHRIRDNATNVSAAVEEQSGVAKTIAGSVRDAAERVGEVDANMGGIEQAATDTGIAADQVSGSSSEVEQVFGTMKRDIEGVLDDMGIKA